MSRDSSASKLSTAELKRHSKFLSLVLRHKPEEIGLELDASGWVSIANLLEALERSGKKISQQLLLRIVEENDKKRFAISDDGLSIRASQGHSVAVELGYSPEAPPAQLYHGTVKKFLPSIRDQGLIAGQRHHVHLSANLDTAIQVASRRGNPVILEVDSQKMAEEDLQFYVSENGVWLTDHVPIRFISFPNVESGY